jgi:hypothetical protein
LGVLRGKLPGFCATGGDHRLTPAMPGILR